MLLLSWVLIVIGAGIAGYYIRDLEEWKASLMTRIWESRKPEPPPEEPTGKVVEPNDDPVAAAKQEFDAMQRKLNERPRL